MDFALEWLTNEWTLISAALYAQSAISRQGDLSIDYVKKSLLTVAHYCAPYPRKSRVANKCVLDKFLIITTRFSCFLSAFIFLAVSSTLYCTLVVVAVGACCEILCLAVIFVTLIIIEKTRLSVGNRFIQIEGPLIRCTQDTLASQVDRVVLADLSSYK